MAKATKKAAPKKQQSKDESLKINGTMDDVLKASFSKPKQSKQERFDALYNAVGLDIKKAKNINNLTEICAVYLDKDESSNQVNLDFILNASSLDSKTELKKSFDRRSKEYGFTMNYPNLSGTLYNDEE